MRSLEFQAGRISTAESLPATFLEKAKQHLAQNYPKFRLPSYGTEALQKRILHVLERGGINLDGSPGIPLSNFCNNNEEVLTGEFCNLLASTALYRLQRMLHEDLTHLTPQELISEGLMDAIKLFIKGEPHNSQKVRQGRLRLISSSSLIFQVVERVVFTDITKECVANWESCFSKPGIGFNEEKNKVMYDELVLMFDRFQRIFSNDVSGWDWSVFFQLVQESCNFIIDKALEDVSDTSFKVVWRQFMNNYVHFITTALFCTSDGQVYQIFGGDGEAIRGIMKSGLFVTGFLNSIMRALLEVTLAFEAGASDVACATMGDDCLRYCSVDIPVERYLDFGIRIKPGAQDVRNFPEEPVDFCSHLYLGGKHVELSSWAKCIYKTISSPYDRDLWHQIAYEIRYNRNFREIEDFLLYIGWLPSRTETLLTAGEPSGPPAPLH